MIAKLAKKSERALASGYNGHKNWAYWNVSLWIYNDESMYGFVKDIVKKSRTLDIAASEVMSYLEGQSTLDGAKYTKRNVRAALIRDM